VKCGLRDGDVLKPDVGHRYYIHGTNGYYINLQADCERGYCLASIILSGLLELSQRAFVATTYDSSEVTKEMHEFAMTDFNSKCLELFA